MMFGAPVGGGNLPSTSTLSRKFTFSTMTHLLSGRLADQHLCAIGHAHMCCVATDFEMRSSLVLNFVPFL